MGTVKNPNILKSESKMRVTKLLATLFFSAFFCLAVHAEGGLSIEKRIRLITAFGDCDATRPFTNLPPAILIKGLAIAIDQNGLDKSLRENLSAAEYRDAKTRLEIYLEAAKKSNTTEDAALLKAAYLEGYKCVLKTITGDGDLENKAIGYIGEADVFFNELGTTVTPHEYMESAAAFELEVMKDIVQHYYMTSPSLRQATDSAGRKQEERQKNVLKFLKSNIVDALLGK